MSIVDNNLINSKKKERILDAEKIIFNAKKIMS